MKSFIILFIMRYDKYARTARKKIMDGRVGFSKPIS